MTNTTRTDSNRAAMNAHVRAAEIDRRIGELCRNGRKVFYAYVDGEYVESENRDAVFAKIDASMPGTTVAATQAAAKPSRRRRSSTKIAGNTLTILENASNGGVDAEFIAFEMTISERAAAGKLERLRGAGYLVLCASGYRLTDKGYKAMNEAHGVMNNGGELR